MTREAWTWFGTAAVLLGFLLVALSEMVHRAQERALRSPPPEAKPSEVWGVKADGSQVLLSSDLPEGLGLHSGRRGATGGEAGQRRRAVTRDELAQTFALVLLRNPAMQDITPVALRERAYEYADAFLEEPEEDDDDGARVAPPPRREWRVVPGPNAKLRHLTTCPTREAAIIVLDHARARGDAEAVMERWQEGWVREETTREASRCEPPADLQPASPVRLDRDELAARLEESRRPARHGAEDADRGRCEVMNPGWTAKDWQDVATALRTSAIRHAGSREFEEHIERLAATATEMARQAWNGEVLPCATPGCVDGVNTPSRLVHEAGQAVTLDRGRGRFAWPVEPTTVVPLAPGSYIIVWIWRRREPPR